MRALELDPRHGLFHRVVAYLHDLHDSQIRIAGFFALGYGALELVEGRGSGSTSCGPSS